MKAKRRLWLPTVRVRTALAAVVVVGIALSISGLVIVRLLAASLQAGVDSSAQLRADAVAALAQTGTLPNRLPASGDDAALVQVIAKGRVVAASSNVAGEPPLVSSRSVPSGGVVRGMESLPIGEQGTFRVALRPVTTPGGTMLVIAAAALEPSQAAVRTVTGALAVGLPFVLAVVALTAWILAGRALAPVEAIRAEVAEISTRALERRVPEPGGGDEIARLARTMNDMLARLDSSVGHQRRFVADASHELRSPLAAALTEIEVDLAHPEAANWTTTAQSVRSELERMRRIVEDLLVLARADEFDLARRIGLVDLAEVVISECAHLRPATTVLVDVDAVPTVHVVGNHGELGRMVANLVANAARHARTRVTVTLRQLDGQAELAVSDDGLGILPTHRHDIFERFSRLDEARARDTGGSGLGLAIVKEIVDAHHGRIAVSDAHPGACFTVLIPFEPLSDRPAVRTNGDGASAPTGSP